MSIATTIHHILTDVQRKGDHALCGFIRRFDGLSLKPADLRVRSSELRDASKKISPAFQKAMVRCAGSIRDFARLEKKRLPKSWVQKMGSRQVGQNYSPVDSVGLYVPGGRFPYPSTVLMTAIPAREAGVRRVILCTPPKNLTPEVLACAALAGVDEVYRVGGPGAIAAMAYGTPSIKPVKFIVGPGNAYVTEAKRQVYGHVGIDSLAGPSEVVVVADRSVPVSFVTKDLMAQAEHDPDSVSILLSHDAWVLSAVKKALDPSIRSRVKCIKVRTIEEAIEKVNDIAPEHFELLVKNAKRYLPLVRNAGAIFLGPASPAAMGDYVAGPSHVLPTQRSAHFSSGLSVQTFLKRSSVIAFEGRPTETPFWEAAITMSQTEGMRYHEESLQCRLHKA